MERMLTPYEQQVLARLQAWEQRKPTMIQLVSQVASRPRDWAVQNLIPKAWQHAAGERLYHLLSHANDAVHVTVSHEPVLRKSAEFGVPIEATIALRAHELQLSDRLCVHFLNPHMLATTLTGAGCGLGGLPLLAIDIPALFTVNLRMVQHAALCYGYDLADPAERHFALRVFNAAADGQASSKLDLALELDVAAKVLARAGAEIAEEAAATALTRSSLDRVARSNSVALSMVGLRKTAQQVGIQITDKKMLQMVPVIGAGIGAGFNYAFSRNVATAAQMGYRKRFLHEKYPGLFATQVVAG